jgi:hypothetical protein
MHKHRFILSPIEPQTAAILNSPPFPASAHTMPSRRALNPKQLPRGYCSNNKSLPPISLVFNSKAAFLFQTLGRMDHSFKRRVALASGLFLISSALCVPTPQFITGFVH